MPSGGSGKTATLEQLTLPFIILALGLAMGAFFLLYRRYYVRVPPNRALVVYGRRRPGRHRFIVVPGGGRFVQPIVEAYDWLSLEAVSIDAVFDHVVVGVRTSSPVHVQVRAAVVAKIGGDEDHLQRAAESLLGQPKEELERIIRGFAEGNIRGVFASTSWAELESDPGTAIETATRLASNDLDKIGVVLVSLQIPEYGREGREAEAAAAPRPDDAAQRIDALEARLRRAEERLGLRPP